MNSAFGLGDTRVRYELGRKCNQDSVLAKQDYFDSQPLCTFAPGAEKTEGIHETSFFFFLTYCMPIGSSLTAARRFCGDYEKKHIGFLPYVGSKENQGVTQLGCLTNRLTLEQEKDIQWYKSAHIPSIFSNQQYFLLVQQYTFQDETCQF